jgi:anti-sigma-K factor RskA
MTGIDDTELLAAEYALGALMPDERRIVDARRATEPALDGAISAWEQRLSPLSAHIPPMTPPPEVRRRLLELIGSADADGRRSAEVVVLRRHVARWRMRFVAAAAVAATLALVVGWQVTRDAPGAGDLAGVLLSRPTSDAADEPPASASPVFMVTVEAESRTLTVRRLAGPPLPRDMVYRLWLIPDGGHPAVPLGTVSGAQEMARVPWDRRFAAAIQAASLAISVEPGGAAPGSRPSTPFVSIGRLAPRS